MRRECGGERGVRVEEGSFGGLVAGMRVGVAVMPVEDICVVLWAQLAEGAL